MAKVIIQKSWLTEEEIEAPDGLNEEELQEWLRDGDNVGGVANDLTQASWDGTVCMDEEGEKLDDWG